LIDSQSPIAAGTSGRNRTPRASLDLDCVSAALDKVGATSLVHQMDRGLQTPIGSSFDDGVQLSGGQWQKVALARTMMRIEAGDHRQLMARRGTYAELFDLQAANYLDR
jgi:ABC-type multidrug transport system fused ATPase/permease subunit